MDNDFSNLNQICVNSRYSKNKFKQNFSLICLMKILESWAGLIDSIIFCLWLKLINNNERSFEFMMLIVFVDLSTFSSWHFYRSLVKGKQTNQKVKKGHFSCGWESNQTSRKSANTIHKLISFSWNFQADDVLLIVWAPCCWENF